MQNPPNRVPGLPSTAQTVAVEMLIWAQADLLETRTEGEIAYSRRVMERRLAAYRIVMEHPGTCEPSHRGSRNDAPRTR
jgi:hypothetical protein